MSIAARLDAMKSATAPAGTTTPRVIFASADGVLICYGTAVPGAVAGYAPGCLFLHTDGGDATALYVNEGTAATADFDAVLVDT
jgi:hypothetical protein